MKAVSMWLGGLMLGCLLARPLSAQPSPEELDILRAIARVRVGDTAPSPATRAECRRRVTQRQTAVDAFCGAVLSGFLPRDSTVWIVFIRTDHVVNLARFLGHPLVIAPTATVYCPSRKPRSKPSLTAGSEKWFGHLPSVRLIRKGPALVLATVRLECWDEGRPVPNGKPSRFYETREYQVVKRGGHWQAIAGMINVT